MSREIYGDKHREQAMLWYEKYCESYKEVKYSQQSVQKVAGFISQWVDGEPDFDYCDIPLKEFVQILRNMIRVIRIQDEKRQELLNLIDRYAYAQSTFNKLIDLMQIVQEADIAYPWVLFLFVQSCMNYSIQNLSQNAYLIILSINFKYFQHPEAQIENLCNEIDGNYQDLLRLQHTFNEIVAENILTPLMSQEELHQLYLQHKNNENPDYFKICQEYRPEKSNKAPIKELTQTPISMAMELNKWLHEIVISTAGLSNRLKNLCSTHLRNILNRMVSYKMELARLINNYDQSTIRIDDQENSLVEQACRLYLKALEALLVNEANKQNSFLTNLLENEHFHRSLLACSAETVLLVKNIIQPTFEQLLELSRISVFDFWKLISSFAHFDPKLPHLVKFHFREIEIKILSYLGWNCKSPLSYIIRNQDDPEDQRQLSIEVNHPSFDLFFKRVLQHCSQRIIEISQSVGIREDALDKIWSCLKYVLSTKPHLLVDRHLDQILVCIIFGVCRVSQPIQFKILIDTHKKLYGTDENIFRAVKLQKKQTTDIINFYNTVFINQMKLYLLRGDCNSQPVFSIFNTQFQLKDMLPSGISPRRSPIRSQFFICVRTSKTYAFHNVATPTIRLNNIKTKQSRELSIQDRPVQRSRHLKAILETKTLKLMGDNPKTKQD